MMKRRKALLATGQVLALAPLLTARAWAQEPTAQRTEPSERLATAWHQADGGHHVGVLHIDWAAGQVQVQAATPVPSRAHGLLALADGGFVALANRPGRWILRCDAQGRVLRLHTLEGDSRTLNGHAAASLCGQWIYTTETDPHTGAGWLSVRDAQTLQRVADCGSHGTDPHQLLLQPDGSVMVANGGIARDALGRKLDEAPMAPSLVRLNPTTGLLLGQWTLPDPQLSLRHLAWSNAPVPTLGVALQAEHHDPALRLAAPALAVWEGKALTLPTADARCGGYAGDIAAAPGGGFVISAQKQGRALWWRPQTPDQLALVAELTEPCALVATADGLGFSLSAGRGAARWHSRLPPRMLRWPLPLAPDNHWVRLPKAA